MAGQNQGIAYLLTELKEKETLAAVKNGLERGDDPLLIMDQCQEGIIEVGKRYENGEYFISALIMAGEIMNQISDIILPILQDQVAGRGGYGSGTILLATVQKDIHFIGKNIFKVLLQCTGYTVHDLGEDVSSENIIEEVIKLQPDIVGLSCLLSSCYDSMKETITALRENEEALKVQPQVIIGGKVNEKVCQFVGADAWADDALLGLRICNRLILK